MSNLSPSQVIAWLRDQSRRFSEMADFIENSFKAGDTANMTGTKLPLTDRVHKLLSDGKARRAKDIAAAIGEPLPNIKRLIESNGTLETNERGWVSIAASEGGAQ